MATQTRLISLEWENGNLFEMKTKLDNEDILTIIKVEENGEIAKLWPHIQKACEAFFSQKIDEIGRDMKA